MNISEMVPHDLHQAQQFHRLYGVNALLPDIDWNHVFEQSKITPTHIEALNTLYQNAVPLALQVFDELNFDVFTPAEYKPQGLGLFEKLTLQEEKLLQVLRAETRSLSPAIRHQIWSMLLRGGAVLVFKAWLGKVKTNLDRLDTSQFDELSDLLFIKTPPIELANWLMVDVNDPYDHIFLMHDNQIYLDRFNSLETAALFVDLGVYDAAFLSLRDDRVAEYLKSKGYISQEQIDELECALNPLYCDNTMHKQDFLA